MRTPSPVSLLRALLAAPLFACSAASPEDATPGQALARAPETERAALTTSCGAGEVLSCYATGGIVKVEHCSCGPGPNTTWTPLAETPTANAGAMWLMNDGTVLALIGDQSFSKLTPDSSGSYANGKWTAAGSMLLAKAYFASQVLSSGKLVSCGGEYSGDAGLRNETNFCEIYDPVTQMPAKLNPPPGWMNIGDSPSTMLANGSMLMGNTQGMGNQAALLDPLLLSWSFIAGDNDYEQGYALLQDGDVITAELGSQGSMRYSPGSIYGFLPDSQIPAQLALGNEIGPSMTLMDGRLIWFGATGESAMYTPAGAGEQGTWVAGPTLPLVNNDQLVAGDGPALLEPNGRVLLAVTGSTSSVGFAPDQFVEYTPSSNSFSLVTAGPTAFGSPYTRMLLLPNGHGLISVGGLNQWFDVTFGTAPEPQWAPTITSFPAVVAAGQASVPLVGTQLCGLSEVSTYGDDNQQSETYPTVRAVSASGAVQYLRAHDVTTRSIAPGQAGTVYVDVPTNLNGIYTLSVAAMGISSNAVTVSVIPQFF